MADQANPDNPEGQQELRQDDLVDRLMPDPSQPQSLTILSGFLARSQQAGHWRLYLTPTLDEYVEIPEENIVHSRSLESGESALGGTMVWVRSSTPLQYTRTTSRQIQAEFLQGAITTGFRARAARFQAAVVLRRWNLLARANYRRYDSVYVCPSDLCSMDVCGHSGHCGGGGEVTSGDECDTTQWECYQNP